MNGLVRVNLFGVCLIFLGGLLLSSSALARGASDRAAAEEIFKEANAAYRQNQFDNAIETYGKIISSGFESGNLYYNLGNSYFKKEEYGRALLNYERALLFIPGDSDLESSRDYVLSLLSLKPELFGNWLERAAGRLFAGVGINGLMILLTIYFAATILLLIFGLLRNEFKRPAQPFLAALGVLLIFSAIGLKEKIDRLERGGVVVSKRASVQFEPMQGATVYFELPEGSSVQVLETAKDWYKINRSDGKIGWIRQEDLGLIETKGQAGVHRPMEIRIL